MVPVGQLIVLEQYRYPWREVFTAEGPTSYIQVYVNGLTGEAEIVQSNDEGEVIRTPLNPVDADTMSSALKR